MQQRWDSLQSVRLRRHAAVQRSSYWGANLQYRQAALLTLPQPLTRMHEPAAGSLPAGRREMMSGLPPLTARFICSRVHGQAGSSA